MHTSLHGRDDLDKCGCKPGMACLQEIDQRTLFDLTRPPVGRAISPTLTVAM